MRYTGARSLIQVLRVALTIIWLATIVTSVVALGATAWMVLSGGDLPGTAGIRVDTPSLSVLFRVPLDGAATRTWVALMMGTVALPMMATVLYIINRLRLILTTLAEGVVFAPENTSRIRGIGVAILVLAAVQWAGGIAAGRFIAQQVHLAGVEVAARLGPDLTTVFFGLLVIVLAEAFRLGTQLQEEQDLTI